MDNGTHLSWMQYYYTELGQSLLFLLLVPVEWTDLYLLGLQCTGIVFSAIILGRPWPGIAPT
jgi:hypothetical protein